MRIAREGFPFILIAAGFSLIIFLASIPAGIVSLLLPAAVAAFFRDPPRTVPNADHVVVSPADGKVLSVAEVTEDRYLNRRMKRICIFLSVFNVHINRVPFQGLVKFVKYTPGKFLMAFHEKASKDSEQNAVMIEGGRGRDVLFLQIAGFIARRIVCYLKGGESVQKGERFGLIRFGSRMDVYLPLDAEVLVNAGDKVVGGETVIARFL